MIILKILACWLALAIAVWWLLTWRARRDRRESLNRHDNICKLLGLPRRRK